MPVALLLQSWPVVYALVVLISLFTSPALANDIVPLNQKTISVGIVADNEPYSSYGANGTEGFSVDVLNEVSRISGLKFEYRVGSWSDIFAAFQRGEIDVVDEISWSEDRA